MQKLPSNLLYSLESLLIDLFCPIKSFKIDTVLIFKVIKLLYEQNVNVPANNIELNGKFFKIEWIKGNRLLELLIDKDKVNYTIKIINVDDLKENQIICEKGLVLFNLPAAMNRLGNWLMRGEILGEINKDGIIEGGTIKLLTDNTKQNTGKSYNLCGIVKRFSKKEMILNET